MLGRRRSLAESSRMLAVVPAACWFCACGDAPVVSHPGEPTGDCSTLETRFENGMGDHVTECSDIEYPMSPPVFGDHYPRWAAYQTYEIPLPLGFLVHNLEHGAVVVFYNCPEGCPDEVAQAQLTIDALPFDPRCSDTIKHQVILVPEPSLGSRWGAAAWGFSTTGDCFDAVAFREFYAKRLGRGPEDLCHEGVAFTETPCP